MNDLALVNGKVVTMNPAQPMARAVLVRGGRIALVGTSGQIAAERDAGTETIDLHGRTVLPGFIDTHVHLASTGLARQSPFLGGCQSIAELLAMLRNYPFGDKPLIRAAGLDTSRLREGRYPNRWELDDVFGDRLVYIATRDGHSGVLNSRTLKSLSLPESTPGIDRDFLTGEPDGVLRGQAWELAGRELSTLLDSTTWLRDLRAVMRDALRVGITTLHALDGGWVADMVYAFREMAPVKIVLYYQSTDIDDVLALGLPRIGGCLLVDGSLGARTAALFEAYADDSGTCGTLYFSDEELTEFVCKVNAANLQLAMHAIGDRAIEQLLNAYETALGAMPRTDHRHRIEHFGLATAQQIERAARLGLHLGVQPAFCFIWGGEGGMFWQRLGPERYRRAGRLRAWLDAGLVAGGGSDSFVSPMDPLLGIHGAVNCAPDGLNLDVQRAISLFTTAAARLAFEEDDKGAITTGRAGDFVVLDADPFTVWPGEIKDIPVVLTIVDGDVRYAAPGT